MKIEPVPQYPLPRYPTLRQFDMNPGLLARTPERWQGASRFVSMLGAGLVARLLLLRPDPASAEAGDTPVPAPSEDAVKPGAKTVQKDAGQLTTLVAPVLAEALEYDGRGSFGCVAINPPTILPEDEAIEVIRSELASVGLALEEAVGVSQIAVPMGERGLRDPMEALRTTETEEEDRFAGKVGPMVDGKFEFDLADKDRAVYVEFLSLRDHDAWHTHGNTWSSVSSYNFPKLVRRIAEEWAKRPSDRKTYVGLFFDPLASADVEMPDLAGLKEAQREQAFTEYRNAMREAHEKLDERAREKLREQVRHFVKWLQEQGVVKSPAATAS